MKYVSKEKDWKYHAKSFLVTLGSTFVAMLVTLYVSYDFKSINPAELTLSGIVAGLVSFARSAFVLFLVALQSVLSKR